MNRSYPRHPAFRTLFVFVLCLLAACGGEQTPRESAAETEGRALSLVEHWGEVEVEQPTPPPVLPPRAEVLFAEAGGVAASWRAAGGIEDLRVEDGALVGRTTSGSPVIVVDFEAPQGTDDELWSVEIRLRASTGSRVGVHPMAVPGTPLEVVQARIDAWPVSTALVAGEEAATYSVVLDRVFLLEMMPALGDIRRLAIRPTNVEGADFALESVRLVFRKERLATIDSGPGWHGLGEVFREALVARVPETLRFELTLPERPWLELAVGSIDEPSPTFRVEVASGGETVTLAELEAEAAEKWRPERLDLGRFAGERVELRLSATGEDGQLAFWGTPTVRDSLPADAPPEGPQAVVLFLADTLRADHLEAWGYDRSTAPTLARLAAEGAVFRNTVSQATWTKVSVSSILTSLYPSTTGVRDLHDRISAGETTLAEVFRDAGYATFATSSVPFSGQLTNLHQGVEVMYEFGAVPDDGARTHQSKTAKVWVDAYLEWLEDHRDVPTLGLIHAMDPHSPFRPEAPYDTLWSTPEDAERFDRQAEKVQPLIESPLLRRFLAPTREELERAGVDAGPFVAQEKAWYDGSIRAMDVQVERLVQQLGELGLEDSTLLAFVADHGEEFLEHGKHWHGNSVYGELSNVPMALWGAGVPAGVVVEETVQTIDLMPTLLALAGLEVPERVQGRSLAPLLAGADTRPRPAFVEHHGSPSERTSFAIVEDDLKLVWFPAEDNQDTEDAYELYDRRLDPLDLNDIAAEHPQEVERLAAELERWRSWAENQRLDESEALSELSAEQLEQLRSLGYVE